MKRDLSQLTFENSYFFKRARKIVGEGRLIFRPESIYNESNEKINAHTIQRCLAMRIMKT